jgi:hypothetical protein
MFVCTGGMSPISKPPPPRPNSLSDCYVKLDSTSIGFWKMSEITVRLSNNRFKPSIIQFNYTNLCTKFWQKCSDSTCVSCSTKKLNFSCKFEIKLITASGHCLTLLNPIVCFSTLSKQLIITTTRQLFLIIS